MDHPAHSSIANNRSHQDDPDGEGMWQPDHDPDLSKQVNRAHREAERQSRVVEPDAIWMPDSYADAQSVTVDEYQRDPNSDHDLTQAAQFEEQVGDPAAYPNPIISRNNFPAWVTVAAAGGLLLAILLFRGWGIFVFVIALFAIAWLTTAFRDAQNNE